MGKFFGTVNNIFIDNLLTGTLSVIHSRPLRPLINCSLLVGRSFEMLFIRLRSSNLGVILGTELMRKDGGGIL